jgi:hypothetical protein
MFNFKFLTQMNLVQKLPIGLSLACMVMLSSCSKEDVQSPTPQAAGGIENSSLRSSGGELIATPTILNALPVFPSTGGPAGLNSLPAFWNNVPGNPKPATYGSGTSTLLYLWGESVYPWQLALPILPSDPSNIHLVTVTSGETGGSLVHNGSKVETKIRNLIPGKKYAIKFWVSTTKRGVGTAYAKKAAIYLGPLGFGPTICNYVDLTNKKATWIEKVLTFTATSAEMPFSIAGYNEQTGVISYVHLFVGQNAISQID